MVPILLHDRRMHRFRVLFCGSPAGSARAEEALEQLGGLPIGPREPSCWVWSSDAGWDAIAELSRERPGVLLSVEGFADYEDELVTAYVIDGDVDQVGSRGLLPPGWGSTLVGARDLARPRR